MKKTQLFLALLLSCTLLVANVNANAATPLALNLKVQNSEDNNDFIIAWFAGSTDTQCPTSFAEWTVEKNLKWEGGKIPEEFLSVTPRNNTQYAHWVGPIPSSPSSSPTSRRLLQNDLVKGEYTFRVRESCSNSTFNSAWSNSVTVKVGTGWGEGLTKKQKIMIIAGSVVGFLIIVGVGIFCWRRRKSAQTYQTATQPLAQNLA